FAEWPEPLGDVVADEALEDQDQVDPVVPDALLERVEDGGLGVFIGFPVEAIELEDLLQRLAHVFADATADHECALSLGGRDEVAELSLEDFAVLAVVLPDPVEVAPQGTEAVSARDELTEWHDQLEERGVGGTQAVDHLLQQVEELVN